MTDMLSRSSAKPGAEWIPPVRHGDRLSRDEFERRYEATRLPPGWKAELIDNLVYIKEPALPVRNGKMPSPVKDTHGNPNYNVVLWTGFYLLGTPGVAGSTNGTVRMDLGGEPQPDAFLRILTECGGRTRVDKDGYIAGLPELLAEIAASSASYDLGAKLAAYLRNGALEYLVWRVWENAIDWFVNRDGRFVPIASGPDGILRSTVFPGLWLDADALIRGDLAEVNQVVQRGLASPEHAAFVEELERRVTGA